MDDSCREIIGGLAATVVALATACWFLIRKIVKCHEARTKYLEDHLSLVRTLRNEIEKQRGR